MDKIEVILEFDPGNRALDKIRIIEEHIESLTGSIEKMILVLEKVSGHFDRIKTKISEAGGAVVQFNSTVKNMDQYLDVSSSSLDHFNEKLDGFIGQLKKIR